MNNFYPTLPYHEWKDTCATLHLWTQIVGKIRLELTPWTNHSWHSTLYVSSRGLTTTTIPHGKRMFQIDFDFIDHKLFITTTDGATRILQLGPRSVADFYKELFSKLSELNLNVKIHTTPNELVDPIPLDQDNEHKSYDADYVNRFWRTLVQADRILKRFRARYIGKCSPIHFFWGSFDLAVTRFSGGTAPEHPGGVPNLPDRVVREAYSHEVSSCGWWPGNEQYPQPAFYSYTYPEPPGFANAPVQPAGAGYDTKMREFIFPDAELLKCASIDDAVLDFAQSTYEAGANLAKWNRSELERDYESFFNRSR
ncbi:MAG TPA: DUF5996 family protein [Acidobacteriota bacterium]|nr:DUF5996 family protein [Acidobacteriota bacterium]